MLAWNRSLDLNFAFEGLDHVFFSREICCENNVVFPGIIGLDDSDHIWTLGVEFKQVMNMLYSFTSPENEEPIWNHSGASC